MKFQIVNMSLTYEYVYSILFLYFDFLHAPPTLSPWRTPRNHKHRVVCELPNPLDTCWLRAREPHAPEVNALLSSHCDPAVLLALVALKLYDRGIKYIFKKVYIYILFKSTIFRKIVIRHIFLVGTSIQMAIF